MKKLIKLLFLMMSMLVLFFAGCKQSLGFDPIDNTEKNDVTGSVGKTVTLTGSLAVDGDAAPSAILAMLGGASGRSAVTSGYMFNNYKFALKVVEDENRTNVIPVEFSETDKTKFTLTLETGKVYKITELSITNGVKTSTLSYRYECNGIEREINLKNLTGTEENKLNVFIIPYTATSGDAVGKIALEISSQSSNVVSLSYSFSNADGTRVGRGDLGFSETTKTASLELSQVTPATGGATIDLLNGIYDFTFEFKTSDGTVVVVSYQKINVFAGFVTDTWISDGSAFFTEVDGVTKFVVSDAAVNAYNNPKEFYVKGTYIDPSAASGSGAEVTSWGTGFDTNSGTSIKKPFATLQQAIDTVIAANDGTSEYTIYVKDTVSPKVTSTMVDGETLYSGSMADFNSFDDTKDLKLTIVGVSVGTTLDGVYSAGANDKKCGPMVKADGKSKLNLTLKNLTITNGETGMYGAGIYNSGSDITLENCVISKNTAQNGGGIYNDGGTIKLAKCSVSENNGHNGGGIYNKTGTVILENASVTKNTYSLNDYSDYGKGGGVYNLGTFEMINSLITENGVRNYDSNGGTSVGSGIYNGANAVFKIENGTIEKNIADNAADKYGIYFDTGSSVELKDSFVIGHPIIVAESGATSITSKAPCIIKRTDNIDVNKNFKMVIVNEGATLNLTGTVENRIVLDGNISSNENFYDNSIIDVKGALNASYCDLKNNYKNSLPNSCAGAIEISAHRIETEILLANCTITNCGCLNTGGDKGYAGGIIVPDYTTLCLENTQIDCSSARGYGNAVWMNSWTSFLELDGVVSGGDGKPLDVYVEKKVGPLYTPITLASGYKETSKVFVKLEDINDVLNNVVVSNCDTADKAATFDVLYDTDYTVTTDGKLETETFAHAVFQSYCASNRNTLIFDLPAGRDIDDDEVYQYVTEFEIPDGYKAIGGESNYSVFGGCMELVSVTIPGSVTKIGMNTFYQCTELETVIIPSIGVTDIGDHAFYGCSSLKTITIPESVTSIGTAAFQGCSITKITIPEGVTSIENSTFSRCFKLESINIPASVKTIGNSAFNSCANLKSITIPASVTSIGETAFSGCTALDYVLLEGDTLPSIASGDPFPDSNGSKYDSIVVSNAAYETIEANANDGWDGIIYLWRLKKILTAANLRSELDLNGASVSTVENYIVPDTYAIIDSHAFDGCANLKAVIIPGSVKLIADEAFANCANLERVTLKQSCYEVQGTYTKLGSNVFGSRSAATFAVLVPPYNDNNDGVKNYKNQSDWTDYKDFVKSSMFDKAALEALNLSSDVTEIAIPFGYVSVSTKDPDVVSEVVSAFASYANLNSMTIPECVTAIETASFRNCFALATVTIPNTVTVIGESAFENCTALTGITLPENLEDIGASAFKSSGFQSIKIPVKVMTIGAEAFSGCNGEITIDEHTSGVWMDSSDQTISNFDAALRAGTAMRFVEIL